MRRLVGFLCLLSIISQLTGCATMRGETAYNDKLSRLVMAHVYNKQCVEIERTARTFLFDDGFSVKQSDGVNVETEWRYERDSNGREVGRRYLVQFSESEGPRCAVSAREATQQRDSGQRDWSEGAGRDWTLEHRLLQVHDPAAARDYERQASAARECAIQEMQCEGA